MTDPENYGFRAWMRYPDGDSYTFLIKGDETLGRGDITDAAKSAVAEENKYGAWCMRIDRWERSEDTHLEWLRRERLDGDPLWTSAIGHLSLEVNVPIGCPWGWEWCVQDADGIDLARGDLMLDEPDDDTEWDYQGVDIAERRCEGVARALLSVVAPGPKRPPVTEDGS